MVNVLHGAADECRVFVQLRVGGQGHRVEVGRRLDERHRGELAHHAPRAQLLPQHLLLQLLLSPLLLLDEHPLLVPPQHHEDRRQQEQHRRAQHPNHESHVNDRRVATRAAVHAARNLVVIVVVLRILLSIVGRQLPFLLLFREDDGTGVAARLARAHVVRFLLLHLAHFLLIIREGGLRNPFRLIVAPHIASRVLARGEGDLRHHDPLGAEVEVDGGEAAAVRHCLVKGEREVASEARADVVASVVIGSEDQILLSEVLPLRVAKENGRSRGGLKKEAKWHYQISHFSTLENGIKSASTFVLGENWVMGAALLKERAGGGWVALA